MAFTATVLKKDVVGSLRAHHFDVTADAQSGSVDSGLGFIDSFQVTQVSMATNSLVKFRPNISAASAASNGILMVSGTTNGDRFFVTVWGH